jgi:NAD(P)-dependent dehydrogenase (short-subunit alcohol dehydrogenase family)
MTAPVVLITGALTGIGRATATAFARDGGQVVVSGRHPDDGEALATELRGLGAQAAFVQADVRREDEVAALVDATLDRFGRLDVAVNDAGTDGQWAPIVNQSADNYTATFDTNVLGMLLCLKHEMRAMQPQRSGSIVNVSSVAGERGMPGASVYVASKHAVIGLTKSAALEGVEHGVRVNAVAPGPIETSMYQRTVPTDEDKAALLSMVPQGRPGQPDEVADAIVFLASQHATYVTGQTINVDGGFTA